MTKKRPQVALVYDFDGTLSPGNMQEFGFIQATGKTKDEFWEKNRKFAEGKDANGILTYMYLMLDEAKKNNISLTRESFQKFGKDVELFRGVKQWFSLVNEYGNSIGLDVKHYINSSGLKEMIEGSVSLRPDYLFTEYDLRYTDFNFRSNRIAQITDSHSFLEPRRGEGGRLSAELYRNARHGNRT